MNDTEMTQMEAYMDARYAADMLAEAMIQFEKGDFLAMTTYMNKAMTKLLEDLRQWEQEHGVKIGLHC